MDLHPGEEIVFEGHPSWRGVLSFYVKGLGIALAIGAILFFAIAPAPGIGAFAVVMALVVLAGLVKRMATRYAITTERLNIRTGILSKHVQQTNIDRVQNVNTEQTLLDRDPARRLRRLRHRRHRRLRLHLPRRLEPVGHRRRRRPRAAHAPPRGRGRDAAAPAVGAVGLHPGRRCDGRTRL